MTVAAILPNVFPQYSDENGHPYAFGSLVFTASGTNTPVNVYSDVGLLVSIGNIVALNAAARPTSNGVTLTSIFMYPVAYRVRLENAAGAEIWTVDNIYDILGLVTAALSASVQIYSGSGSVNDLALTISTYHTPQIFRAYNSTDLTITGFGGALTDGQRLVVMAAGAGNVYLPHESGSSQPAYRMLNIATGTATRLLGGSGIAEFVYDSTASRWRMVSHEFGGLVSYSPTWSSASSAPVIGNGLLTGRYTVRGRIVTVNLVLSIGSTTTLGTGAWEFTLPVSAEDTNAGQGGDADIYDAGTGTWRMTPALTSMTKIALWVGDGTANKAGGSTNIPMTWASGDAALISFSYITA